MSIFTQTFPTFVINQLTDRENILSIGNSLSSNRMGQPKNKRYPAGAFYTNTVERQCILRMSSGVDLNPEGERNILKKASFEEREWKGENLAKNWVLEGGVPVTTMIDDPTQKHKLEGEVAKAAGVDPGTIVDDGDTSVIKDFRPRAGFTNQPDNRTAYGDPRTRSDAGDGFGIVPMPGIIDAQIKVKSAYGSLREAKVNFVCHNRRQLEILELLYMRPGYTILLEWGWTPHIKRSGAMSIKSTDFFPMKDFWDGFESYETLNTKLYKKRDDAGGNYDAMLGYCKNFEIKVREDGGYDCSTSIISTGEVLEAIKGKRNFPPLKMGEDEESKVYDNFEIYLMACRQYCKAIKYISKLS